MAVRRTYSSATEENNTVPLPGARGESWYPEEMIEAPNHFKNVDEIVIAMSEFLPTKDKVAAASTNRKWRRAILWDGFKDDWNEVGKWHWAVKSGSNTSAKPYRKFQVVTSIFIFLYILFAVIANLVNQPTPRGWMFIGFAAFITPILLLVSCIVRGTSAARYGILPKGSFMFLIAMIFPLSFLSFWGMNYGIDVWRLHSNITTTLNDGEAIPVAVEEGPAVQLILEGNSRLRAKCIDDSALLPVLLKISSTSSAKDWVKQSLNLEEEYSNSYSSSRSSTSKIARVGGWLLSYKGNSGWPSWNGEDRNTTELVSSLESDLQFPIWTTSGEGDPALRTRISPNPCATPRFAISSSINPPSLFDGTDKILYCGYESFYFRGARQKSNREEDLYRRNFPKVPYCGSVLHPTAHEKIYGQVIFSFSLLLSIFFLSVTTILCITGHSRLNQKDAAARAMSRLNEKKTGWQEGVSRYNRDPSAIFPLDASHEPQQAEEENEEEHDGSDSD